MVKPHTRPPKRAHTKLCSSSLCCCRCCPLALQPCCCMLRLLAAHLRVPRRRVRMRISRFTLSRCCACFWAAGWAGAGGAGSGQGREDECALSRCCACFCAAYRAGVAARLRYCHELADSLFIRVMQATKAMQAKKAGAALDRLGMSSVLDTDLQANSMPLLLSTTVLQASKWMIQQSEQRVGLNLQLFTCRLGAAAAAG